MTIQITPVSDAIGCEVSGVDLKTATDGEINEIVAGLDEHLLAIVRTQNLSPVEYAVAARRFGDLAPQHMSDLKSDEEPSICVLDSSKAALDKAGRPRLVGEGNWHVDHTNLDRPPKYTMLYAKKLPSKGGDTGFANMQKA